MWLYGRHGRTSRKTRPMVGQNQRTGRKMVMMMYVVSSIDVSVASCHTTWHRQQQAWSLWVNTSGRGAYHKPHGHIQSLLIITASPQDGVDHTNRLTTVSKSGSLWDGRGEKRLGRAGLLMMPPSTSSLLCCWRMSFERRRARTRSQTMAVDVSESSVPTGKSP